MRLRPTDITTTRVTIRIDERLDLTFITVKPKKEGEEFALKQVSRTAVYDRGPTFLEHDKDFKDALALAYKTVRMAREETKNPTEGRTPESFRLAIMASFYNRADGQSIEDSLKRAAREMGFEERTDILKQAGAILAARNAAFKRMLPDPAPPRPNISPTKARLLAIQATPGTKKQFLLPKKRPKARHVDSRQRDMF